MITLTTLFFIATSLPQQQKRDEFMIIGRHRADFGDNHSINPPFDLNYPDYDPIWNAHSSRESPPTEIFFAAGTFLSRYYLQMSTGADPPEKRKYWLALEYRRNPMNKWGSNIVFEWKVQLAYKKPKSLPPSSGTLEKILYNRGLQVAGPVSARVKAGLKDKRGVAAYMFSPPAEPAFVYWYVLPDGTETKKLSYDSPWPEYNWNGTVPDTPFPYLITVKEKTELVKAGWKYKRE